MFGHTKPQSVAALIVRDGEVLSVSAVDDDAKLDFGGGKVEPGETLREAIVREMLEEAGIALKPPLILLYEAECDGFWCTTFYVPNFLGEPTNMGQGAVGWHSQQALLRGRFPKYNREALRRFNAWKTVAT
jgi:8-oxo-dGTP diphosphatase